MDKNAYFQKKKNNGNSTDDGDENKFKYWFNLYLIGFF